VGVRQKLAARCEGKGGRVGVLGWVTCPAPGALVIVVESPELREDLKRKARAVGNAQKCSKKTFETTRVRMDCEYYLNTTGLKL
jgi:hypothetical protein